MITKINGIPITTQFNQIDKIHVHPHHGLDLALSMDSDVHAVGDGVVTAITNEGNTSFGKAVHMHLDDGNDVIYGHLDGFKVHVGDRVDRGDVIALSGSTGHSTGAHLHLQVMHNGIPINPTAYAYTAVKAERPWYDISGRIEDDFVSWLHGTLFHIKEDLIHSLFDGLNVILPTAAMIGVLWWLCPFFPKSDKAPKLTGAAMIIYMFTMLVKGAYHV